MAAHAMRYPPARRRRRWPSRVLALLATAAFLGTGVAIALMVMPEPEEEAAVRSTPPPAPAAEQPKAEKRGLTRAQRADRRAAVRTLADQGYEPVRLADWRPRNDLRVLVGESDTGAMRAFFFVDGEFVGNDDATSSTRLRVTKVGDEAITLAYGLSTGGSEKVRFEWVDDRLAATGGTVPPSTLR
jgi:LppP/LprE lipoprotein